MIKVKMLEKNIKKTPKQILGMAKKFKKGKRAEEYNDSKMFVSFEEIDTLIKDKSAQIIRTNVQGNIPGTYIHEVEYQEHNFIYTGRRSYLLTT